MTVAMLSERRHGHDRPRRRLARLPAARRQIEQLTDDHSLVAELVRRGELTPEEAAVHPQRSVITRALGTEPDVDVDVFTIQAAGRRRLPALLRRPLDDGRRRHDRGDPAAQPADLDAATHALIKAANDRGGDDNITAVLFAVADGDAGAAETLLVPAIAATTPTTRTRSTPRTTCACPRRRDAPPSEITMIVSAADLRRPGGSRRRTSRSRRAR